MRRRLLLAAAATGLALLLAERLLSGPLRPELHSLRDEAWQAETRRMHAELYQPDGALVYVPRPSARVQRDYGTAAFNAQGLREEGPIGPPDGRRRVVVAGDSLVWGELLARQDAPPAALGEALGPAWQVLNLGVSGYDTSQEAAWYQRAGVPLQPDVLVLVYCLNDMLIQSGPHELYADAAGQQALAAERAWLDRQAPLRNETVNRLWWQERGGGGSQLLAALRHVVRWHRLHTLPGGYVDDYLLAAREEQRQDRLRDALATLGTAAEAQGTRRVLVISPALYWWHRYQWGEVHALVRTLGEAAGFEVLDPLDQWRGEDPAPFRFPGDNLHYTAHGSQRLAEVIARALHGAQGRGSSAPGR